MSALSLLLRVMVDADKMAPNAKPVTLARSCRSCTTVSGFRKVSPTPGGLAANAASGLGSSHIRTLVRPVASAGRSTYTMHRLCQRDSSEVDTFQAGPHGGRARNRAVAGARLRSGGAIRRGHPRNRDHRNALQGLGAALAGAATSQHARHGCREQSRGARGRSPIRRGQRSMPIDPG